MAVRISGAASGDRLERTSGTVLDYNSTFTMCGWVYVVNLPSSGNYQNIFSIAAASGANLDALQLHNIAGTTYFSIYKAGGAGGSGDQTISGLTVSASTWYFSVLCRPDSTNLYGYIFEADGTLTSATNVRSNVGRSSSSVMGLGNAYYSGAWLSEEFDGRIAAYRGWSTNLTTDQMRREMWSYRPQAIANLFQWSPIFAGSSERVRDYHVNGYDWTNQGTLTDEAGPPVPWGFYTQALPIAISIGTNTSDSVYAYIKGQDTASSSQSAYIAGSEAATDSQPAYISGTGGVASDSAPAYIEGLTYFPFTEDFAGQADDAAWRLSHWVTGTA